MLRRRTSNLVFRTITDALVGLALFLTVALAFSAYERTSAATGQLGTILSVRSGNVLNFSLSDSPLIAAAIVATAAPKLPSDLLGGFQRTTHQTAYVLLACIFSALVALNLRFFRHLRREYASPR